MAEVTSSDPVWWTEKLADEVAEARQTPRHRERWKYTRSSKVLALADHASGPQAETAPASLDRLRDRCPEILEWLRLCAPIEQRVIATDTTLELNDELIDRPLKLIIEANVSVKIIQQGSARGITALWLELQDGARVQHARAMLAEAEQWHFLDTRLAENASYELNLHNGGAALHRQDILMDCEGAGAEVAITSAAVVAPGKHLDQQITLNHLAPHTTARQTIHNVARDDANITFNGRIHIAEHAQKTDSQLNNRNLALGEHASINTKPELEIYADDVVCAHGATIGRLDEQQLFYLSARGVAPLEARRMLSRAFLRTATLGTLSEASLREFDQVLGL